jgi:hypothetical protein
MKAAGLPLLNAIIETYERYDMKVRHEFKEQAGDFDLSARFS